MERLTFAGNFCDIAQCRELPCPYDNNCMQKQVWERLKSYEDTRLSPEGLKQAVEIEEYLNECGSSIARVAELIKADDERRVVVLPCKVDDTVYTLNQILGTDNTVHDRIFARKIKGYSGNAINKVWIIASGDSYDFDIFPSEFGKTVFLTREEAEKALEARKDG